MNDVNLLVIVLIIFNHTDATSFFKTYSRYNLTYSYQPFYC